MTNTFKVTLDKALKLGSVHSILARAPNSTKYEMKDCEVIAARTNDDRSTTHTVRPIKGVI
jgi:hypothetical protein